MQTTVDTTELLERLFSATQVIDIDFSLWDDCIGLLTIPEHFEAGQRNDRLPVVLTRFHSVKHLSFEFSHHEALARARASSPKAHMQWHIDDFKVSQREGHSEFVFWAGSSDPILRISCERITYQRVSIESLDKRFPGWTAPGGPFVRPGPDQP